MLKERGLGHNGKIGAIWTLDRGCGWNCDHCCVDAHSVSREGGFIQIQSNDYSEKFKRRKPEVNIYQEAQLRLQEIGKALSLEQKLAIIQNLAGVDIEIGLSGGDLLLNPDNIEVIKALSAAINGKENIGVTTTNMGLEMSNLDEWLPYVAQVEVTYDSPVDDDLNHQESGYNSSNYKALCKLVEKCKEYDVVVKALVPISPIHKNPEIREQLYQQLIESGVKYIYVMRTLPVGRANDFQRKPLSAAELKKIISDFYRLEEEHDGPEVQLMCALKPLFPDKYSGNPCTVGETTAAITSMGDLTIGSFVYDRAGNPLFPHAVMGNLVETPLADIIAQESVQDLAVLNQQNIGHCRVAAYINSGSDDGDDLERFFGNTDPLLKDI